MVQSWNPAAVATLGRVARRPSLLLPHLSLPTLNQLQPATLKAAGVRGVLLDKDNTVTAPYRDEPHPAAQRGLAQLLRHFPGRVAILSNSAGTADFDPSGAEAERLESALGVPVLRHTAKKPMPGAGDLAEVLAHFNAQPAAAQPAQSPQAEGRQGQGGGSGEEALLRADELCVVGDRLLTDVLFGNLHGLVTVHLTSTLSLTGDNAMARLFRGLESEVLLPLLKAVGCEAPRHAGWDKASPPGS
eukprot:COSAG04_NODE_775_length_10405_cov_20.166214_7_plen_245_part_00